MSVEAFIFDMDGVMLDSEPLQLRSFNTVLERYGVSVSMPEFKEKYIGCRDVQICEAMVADFHLPISPEAFVAEKRSIYLQIIAAENVPATAGLTAAVEALYALLPLAIASSSSVREIELIAKKFGIRDLFTVIVSAHQVSHGKSAPDVYLKASELLGVPPEACGVIEDTRTGIRSAKAAGMNCIAITTTHTADELNEANKIISSLDQLVGAVRNL